MYSLALAIYIKQRNTGAVENLISAITATYSEQEAIKFIFKPLLSMFTAEDREWFDQMRHNASWAI